MDGKRPAKPVAIVGAGPIGLATALDLARFGVPSVLLEEDLQVSEGSRAIVLTRRSLEILQQMGVQKPFIEKGLPWSQGRSFYRGREIYKMVMPYDSDDRYLPGLNIQQQYIEEYLLGYCERQPLIDLRWGQRLTALAQDDAAVTLRIDTPDGDYELTADWVVAADGGRSTVRKLMQLRMEGRSYPGRFVIADIKAKINLPTERLCFFDPAWNPGNNVLVHRQPEDLWRIDFRLPDGETEEQALEPALLRRRINAVLSMINQDVEWRLDWATVYSANTLTLGEFVHGRVLLTGDAAHLLRQFGQRQHDQVGRAKHHERGDRPRQHAGFEPQLLGDARGDRVEHRGRMDAAVTGQDRPVALPPFRAGHETVPSSFLGTVDKRRRHPPLPQAAPQAADGASACPPDS